jgi:hypothetical protein
VVSVNGVKNESWSWGKTVFPLLTVAVVAVG